MKMDDIGAHGHMHRNGDPEPDPGGRNAQTTIGKSLLLDHSADGIPDAQPVPILSESPR